MNRIKETCFATATGPMGLTNVVPERCFAPGVVETLEKYAPTKLILPLVTSNSNLEGYGVFSSTMKADPKSPDSSMPISPQESSEEEVEEEESSMCGDAVAQSIVIDDSTDYLVELPPEKEKGRVDVVGLGFITNMAEYMVASDILVTKAGPGTIAEAASVGLPVMLTNFLPGQEEGNVDFVVKGKFGEFCDKPPVIAKTLADWLTDPEKLSKMSLAASESGKPNAAAEIAISIGDQVLHIMEKNNNPSVPSYPEGEILQVEDAATTPIEPAGVEERDQKLPEAEEAIRAEAGQTILNASSFLDLAALDS